MRGKLSFIVNKPVVVHVYKKVEMREEICTEDREGYVGNDKLPVEITTERKCKMKTLSAIGVNGRTICCLKGTHWGGRKVRR